MSGPNFLLKKMISLVYLFNLITAGILRLFACLRALINRYISMDGNIPLQFNTCFSSDRGQLVD